jgi:serine protease inhibitor
MRVAFILLPVVVALFVVPFIALAQSTQDTDASGLVDGDNAFALDLYGRLRGQPGNLFFSPESISTALAMTYAGARGQTAAEMAQTLDFTLPQDRLGPAMGAILRDLNATHSGYQLRAANALWAQQGYPIVDEFLNSTERNYGAAVERADFHAAPEAARQAINQWVEQKTEDKIKDLIGPGVLSRETKLVLANAIYFKGDWETQFDKAKTKPDDFRVSASQAVKAAFMHREGSFNYFGGSTFQALEIPYKSRDLSMIVLLPNDVAGLPALEESLTAANVKQWLAGLRSAPKVVLTLPSFRITAQFQLGRTLAAMGMAQAFDARADFSGINPRRDLLISDVIHKAFVDVNEEGTEAAAATGVIINRAMIAQRPRPPIVFRADHPFVFVIRENKSGAMLFMGRVASPTQ